MNKHFKHFLALLLVAVSICLMIAPTMAATPPDPDSPKASAYISSVYAYGTGGSRSASVYFDITGTGKMTSLGATNIVLYKSGSGYVTQKQYVYYPNMMGYNKSYHSDTESFSGLSAGTYYAIVYYKASNSYGYDTTSYTTDYFYVTN